MCTEFGTSLSQPWMFVSDCRTITNASIVSITPAVSRITTKTFPFPKSFLLGNPLKSRYVKVALGTLHCSQRNVPPNDINQSSSKEPNCPQREIRLHQTWRNPLWLHQSQYRTVRSSAPRRTRSFVLFAGIRDPLCRGTCMGLVLAALGALHYLYQKADYLARHQVQIASAQLDNEISIGRVVRCNPVTGIRVKNVSVSRPSSSALSIFGTAAYVNASVSGFFDMFLLRRPLRLNISVERASITVPGIVTKEYEKSEIETPNLEQPIRMLLGEWKQSAMWTSLSFPTSLEPSTLSFHHSRLRLEGTQETAISQSDHSVEMVNISGKLDLNDHAHRTPVQGNQKESGGNMFFLKGSFRSGGSVRIGMNPDWHHDAFGNNAAPLMTASLICSKVNIGSIASFLSLPFKLVDGYCTGNVELELSPDVSLIPTMTGQAEVKSLGLRFDPSPQNPELRNLTGRVRFEERSLVLDQVEGDLGSIPLEAEGHIDFVEGYNIVGHARPFDVNHVIDTFALDRFIPIEGSVIGKAVVHGELAEPFVSGWIKAVGNRAKADKVLLKSAVVMYDWDAAAGNLLFPSIQAKVVGGGEVTGSGGVYFDMTQETPYGYWNEQHHPRSPKAKYWNPGARAAKSIPSLPVDDFEVDRWAPFRPYDSMEFKIKGSSVSGGNLLRWYGREYGAIASEAIGQIGGSCHISGHVDDSNSRLVWRSSREAPKLEYDDGNSMEIRSNQDGKRGKQINPRHTKQLSSNREPSRTESQEDDTSTNLTSIVPPSEDAISREPSITEYLSGLVHMKLGDLPEARRVKVRTVIKDFCLKKLFAGDPKLKSLFVRAPNAVSSMDTLFKGTVCMRPSWEYKQARKSGRRGPLDLVSIDGALAVRRLMMNGVVFRNVISGSLSLSATDISVSLTESNSQHSNGTDSNLPLVSDRRKENKTESQSSPYKLEVNVNARGLLKVFINWGASEISASIIIDDKMHRIAQLHTKNLDLQQLSGEYNPLYEDEAMHGILSTYVKLDLTDQTGLVNVTATDLALGPLHFGLAQGQFLLKQGEISMQEATIEQRLSKYKLDGRYIKRRKDSDFECFVNVNVDRAHIRDLARLVEGCKAVLESTPYQQAVEDQFARISSQAIPKRVQSTNQFARQDSSVTYWEIPQDLPFSEQTKWFSESLRKDSHADLSFILNSTNNRSDTVRRMYHMENHLSGKVSMHYASPRHGDKRKQSLVNRTDRGPLLAFGNISLSFNFYGRNWILGKNKIEKMSVTGFLEDGSLSLGPFQIKGSDGFLADAECRVTSAGSLDGSINLRNAPVSNFDIFRKAGFDARGDISGKFGMQGTISNPTAYGQMVWQKATVNGRKVSKPHADLACSNGRCLINVDADVDSRGQQWGSEDSGVDHLIGSESVAESTSGEAALNKKTQTRNASSKRRKDTDSIRARVSVPVKLFVHQYVLPRIPRGILPDHLGLIDSQVPFDDDWIFASVDVKRYGMVLLNAAIPKLGWIAGESDIQIRVSGTQKNPEVEGTVKFRDGSLRPKWMRHPLHSLKGDVELKESGLISCKSISGRCNGKGFLLRGGLFLSKNLENRLEEKVQEMRKVISPSDSKRRKRSRHPRSPHEEAESTLRQGRSGVLIETGGIPIEIENVCTGTVSGKFLLTGTVMQPEVDGSLVLSDSVVSANRVLTDGRKSIEARSSRPVLNTSQNTTGKQKAKPPLKASSVKLANVTEKSEYVKSNHQEGQQFDVNVKQLKVSLGRNVRVAHSFLLNVLVTGSSSFSGKPRNPVMSGKINIVSGSVNALPTRWAIRKSESSYVSFVHNPDAGEESQEPLIKLVLESDTIILRVSECDASTWMEHLSLSDKSGNQVSEGWWADAIHESDVDKRGNGRRIVDTVTGLMLNALVVGGEIGKFDWKVFPTYFGYSFPILSRSTSDKYGAGFQLDQGEVCFESNVFADKSKGGQIMVKLAKALSVHLFGDKNRRFARVELRLPGKG